MNEKLIMDIKYIHKAYFVYNPQNEAAPCIVEILLLSYYTHVQH